MKLLFALFAAVFCLSGASFAANNVSQETYIEGYKGKAPIVATVSGTLTSTTSPALTLPSSSYDAGVMTCQRKNSSGNVLPLTYTVSGSDIVVGASPLASGTLAVGDIINCVVVYPRSK